MQKYLIVFLVIFSFFSFDHFDTYSYDDLKGESRLVMKDANNDHVEIIFFNERKRIFGGIRYEFILFEKNNGVNDEEFTQAKGYDITIEEFQEFSYVKGYLKDSTEIESDYGIANITVQKSNIPNKLVEIQTLLSNISNDTIKDIYISVEHDYEHGAVLHTKIHKVDDPRIPR